MKNNAKVGGILSIVAGGWGVLSMFGLVIAGIILLVVRFSGDYYGTRPEGFVGIFLLMWGICCGLLGALAIAGGVFGLRKRLWGLALAGSIASILTFWLCGIPAVIFTAMGKREFEGNASPEAPAAPMEKIVG